MARQTRLSFADKSPNVKAEATGKRKRSTVEDNSQSDFSDNETPKAKKSRVTPKAKATAASAKGTSAKAAKPATKTQKPSQIYKKAIAEVDKKVRSLDAKVQKQGPNSGAVTSPTYAAAMAKFLPGVSKLNEMGAEGAVCALNLLLHLAHNAYGDINASFKMSGYGGHKKPYWDMDELMLKVVEKRAAIANSNSDMQQPLELVEVPHRWSDKDADVGVFKTGRPNKQQRGWIAKQREKWEKERNNLARERRETTKDWIDNAIAELVDSRDYIKDYGHEGFFRKSIARLEELKSNRSGKHTAS